MKANKFGLSLLETLLALSMVAILLVGVATLNLSSSRNTLVIGQETKLQEELIFAFRDVDLYLRNAQSGVDLTYENPSGTKIKSPKFFRGPGSTPFSVAQDPSFWLATKQESGIEVWYGFYRTAANPETWELERRVCTPSPDTDPIDYAADCETTVLSSGILIPYADADLNNDGTVTTGSGSETDLRDQCLYHSDGTHNLVESACESKGVYPVFKVSPGNRVVLVSFRARGQAGAGGKTITSAGMTKPIYFHSTLE